jgi:hypothetical protein
VSSRPGPRRSHDRGARARHHRETKNVAAGHPRNTRKHHVGWHTHDDTIVLKREWRAEGIAAGVEGGIAGAGAAALDLAGELTDPDAVFAGIGWGSLHDQYCGPEAAAAIVESARTSSPSVRSPMGQHSRATSQNEQPCCVFKTFGVRPIFARPVPPLLDTTTA